MSKAYDIDAGTIRRVDWLELVPMTLFFRAFAATFKPSFLILASLLMVLNFYVETCGDLNARFTPSVVCPREFAQADEKIRSGSFERWDSAFACALAPVEALEGLVRDNSPNRSPLTSELNSARTKKPGRFACKTLEAILALWLALAISRTAVVRLTTSSRSSTLASLKFAAKRFPAALLTLVAPACFFLTILFVCFLTKITGVVGAAFSPVTALVLVLLEALMTVFVVAAPMGFAAIGAENCDGFDAISRSVSYVVQRTLVGFVYLVVAQILIFIGCKLLTFVCAPALDFYADSVAAGSLWTSLGLYAILALPHVYAFVAELVYFCAIYVMLRRSVDGTPFETCALNLKGTAPRKLRQLLKDGKGAPTFDAQNAAAQESAAANAAPKEEERA